MAAPNSPNTPAPQSNNFESSETYVSNPYLNTIKGLVLTLTYNPVPALLSSLVGILLYLIVAISVGLIGVLSFSRGLSFRVEGFAITLITLLAILFITTITIGTYYVIAGSSARREVVTTRHGFARAAKKFIPLLIFSFLYVLACLIGFILLIVPGVIILVRGSLGGLVIFEENLGPIKSLRRSFTLTKGHTIEMVGSVVAGWLLAGGGLLVGAVSLAPFVGRYHDFVQLEQTKMLKPKVHWLNYFSFIIAILMAALFGVSGYLSYTTAHKDLTGTSSLSTSQTQTQFNDNFDNNASSATTNNFLTQ